MHKRQYAQRQHLVNAFDSLLYQLHTLSFFLSPSIWCYIFRIISQFQCAKPTDVDLSHTLRFYGLVIFSLNLPSFYMHIVHGASEGRTVVLDFVGMSYTPSRLQLFSLDITILLMQWLLIVISYETAVAKSPEGEDILLPKAPSTPLPSGLPTPITSRPPSPSSSRRPYFSGSNMHSTKPTTNTTNGSDYIIDLRLQPLMTHLRHPPPIISRAESESASSSLPLPNTAPVRLPASLRTLMRPQAALARRSTAEVMGGGGDFPRRGAAPSTGGGGREDRFPGAMDTDS